MVESKSNTARKTTRAAYPKRLMAASNKKSRASSTFFTRSHHLLFIFLFLSLAVPSVRSIIMKSVLSFECIASIDLGIREHIDMSLLSYVRISMS